MREPSRRVGTRHDCLVETALGTALELLVWEEAEPDPSIPMRLCG